MHHLTWRSLAATAVVAGVVAWALTAAAERSGSAPVHVPWTTAGVAVVMSALVLWFAYPVKQYLAGDRPGLDPIRAARTVVFAQAAAYTGALLTGAFGGYALVMAADWAHQPRREVAIVAGLSALAGAALAFSGWLAERWCKIGPDDHPEESATSGTLAT